LNKTTEHTNFYLIGIGNQPSPLIGEDVLTLIADHTIFSGGKRHYELVKKLLPEQHQWIEISGKMELLIEQYKTANSSVVVFASGDPFFYGFGNTLKRLLPDSTMKAFSYFNSIQRLCHKTQMNYNALQAVSVHGRTWSELDAALIGGGDLIGVLTDNKKTPAKIANRLLQYGFDNYQITVGEELDGTQEKIESLDLSSCTVKKHQPLNCVLLQKTKAVNKHFGIPDHEFIPLLGRPKMITKMPIRLSTIHALDLNRAIAFWDVGSCTGSVAIEAKRHYPNLSIVAFEKREECGGIIQRNKERFSTPGIQIEIADFFELELENYPVPDSIFIGGHGNRLEDMIAKISVLAPNAIIVTNAVQESTSTTFKAVLEKLNYKIDNTTIKIDDHNEIIIHKAHKY
jgi:precorrin-6Y C5,15-methyltransferase (decarboxylating)